MSRRNTKQSNHPEVCPVCLRRLSVRFADMSHYRAHVRRGELSGRGWVVQGRVVEGKYESHNDTSKPTEFRFPEHTSDKAWWDRGFAWQSNFVHDRQAMEKKRGEFVNHFWRKGPGTR